MTQETAAATRRDLLLQLAARCEAANGPDRELDVDIALATGLADKPMGGEAGCYKGNKCVWRFTSGMTLAAAVAKYPRERVNAAIFFGIPRVTSSMDCAIGLVPEGRLWSIGSRVKVSGFVAVLDNSGKSFTGATPALALTAAALRALAA